MNISCTVETVAYCAQSNYWSIFGENMNKTFGDTVNSVMSRQRMRLMFGRDVPSSLFYCFENMLQIDLLRNCIVCIIWFLPGIFSSAVAPPCH